MIEQAANYGIGGEYEIHHDYFNNHQDNPFLGDRLTTFLMYVSAGLEYAFFLNQTEFPLVPNQSKNGKYNMILVNITGMKSGTLCV